MCQRFPSQKYILFFYSFFFNPAPLLGCSIQNLWQLPYNQKFFHILKRLLGTVKKTENLEKLMRNTNIEVLTHLPIKSIRNSHFCSRSCTLSTASCSIFLLTSFSNMMSKPIFLTLLLPFPMSIMSFLGSISTPIPSILR